MRKLIVGLGLAGALAIAPAAWGHPSEQRNERAFHGGPHCHVNNQSGNPTYPSHRGHERAGSDVFTALPACPEE
jgi:hypothetical protein